MFENSESQRTNRVIYRRRPLSRKAKKRLKWIGISLVIFIVLCFLLVFMGFPIAFMHSLALQRLLMFTNLNLHTEKSYFYNYEIQPGIRNLYVNVKDKSGILSLGVWHLLPFIYEKELITQEEFSFDDALKDNQSSVLLYFHGTGEDRSDSYIKYVIFRYFFHVITFDYRSYGDSTNGALSENAVVNDCLQLYEWLANKTSAPIFVWGHSLGSALATRTVAELTSKSHIAQPVGLILEAPFTSMRDELYEHPYSKVFAWLPWFKATVIKPLEENGFIFDTSKNILKVHCPIMILNSEDDHIVPYYMGRKLYEIATTRALNNITLYYRFSYDLGYDHNFMFEDSLFPYFINYFYMICSSTNTSTEQNLKVLNLTHDGVQ